MHHHNLILTLYCRDKVRQEFYEKKDKLVFLHCLQKTNDKACLLHELLSSKRYSFLMLLVHRSYNYRFCNGHCSMTRSNYQT